MEEYFDIKDLRIGDKVIYSQKVYEIIELTKSEILIENDSVVNDIFLNYKSI